MLLDPIVVGLYLEQLLQSLFDSPDLIIVHFGLLIPVGKGINDGGSVCLPTVCKSVSHSAFFLGAKNIKPAKMLDKTYSTGT